MSDTQTPRLLYMSHDLRVGALPLLALARSGVEIVGVWSGDRNNPQPPLDAASHTKLLAATTIEIPSPQGVVLEGVFIPDFPTLAAELELTHHHVSNINDLASSVAAQGLELDFVFSAGLNAIPSERLSKTPRKLWLNLQLSRLPEHAGIDPTYWELRKGDLASGITLHCAGPNFFDGAVIEQTTLQLTNNMSYNHALAAKAKASIDVIQTPLPAFLQGRIDARSGVNIENIEAPPSEADWCVQADMSCENIQRLVCAAKGSTSVSLMQEEETYIVEAAPFAEIDPNATGTPGDLERHDHETLKYRCADGWITLLIDPTH